jgi:hypothetical protein
MMDHLFVETRSSYRIAGQTASGEAGPGTMSGPVAFNFGVGAVKW